MNIIATTEPDQSQTEAIYKLWNEEYPAQLGHTNMDGLEAYLVSLTKQQHFFAVTDSATICGWAFTFERFGETWFAIIVASQQQGKGLGRLLLDTLKAQQEVLNGWVTDHERYRKANGDKYPSPLGFYLKNEFATLSDIRLEFEKLSAVKVQWRWTSTLNK